MKNVTISARLKQGKHQGQFSGFYREELYNSFGAKVRVCSERFYGGSETAIRQMIEDWKRKGGVQELLDRTLPEAPVDDTAHVQSNSEFIAEWADIQRRNEWGTLTAQVNLGRIKLHVLTDEAFCNIPLKDLSVLI